MRVESKTVAPSAQALPEPIDSVRLRAQASSRVRFEALAFAP
jgi:hypothetical protein